MCRHCNILHIQHVCIEGETNNATRCVQDTVDRAKYKHIKCIVDIVDNRHQSINEHRK